MKELPPLSLHQACPFLIDVRCEVDQPSIQPLGTNSGPRLLNQALQKSITSRTGAKALRGQENVFIYTYRGEHRVSSLIANKVPSKPCAESDCAVWKQRHRNDDLIFNFTLLLTLIMQEATSSQITYNSLMLPF